MTDERISRRQASLTALGAVGATAVGAAALEMKETTPMRSTRMPTAFLPHGGGPWPFVDLGFGPKDQSDRLRAYLEAVPSTLPMAPRALLVISAH